MPMMAGSEGGGVLSVVGPAGPVLHMASRGYGCPLHPALSYSHEGGLGALALDGAVCFLQPKKLPDGRVPLPVTVLSLGN